MKGVDWAELYDRFHEQTLDLALLEKRISALVMDDEIQRPKGIIPYVLTGNERYLDLRTLPDRV